LDHELGKWYPKRKSLLFFRPCDLVKFKLVSYLICAFYTVGALIDLHARDLLEAISKTLFGVLLLTCHFFGFENYSILLNINLSLFYVFTELLALLALHTNREQHAMLRILLAFKFVSWTYMFLSFLPFQYLLPTVHAAGDFRFLLCGIFVAWYIAKVWTSPLLQVFYHQLYHLNPADCPGEGSMTRCLLVKDSPELRHWKCLRKAYLEVKLHNDRHQLNKLNLSESAAKSKAFQTIKCVMTLKRKLKRIRENQKADQQQPTKK